MNIPAAQRHLWKTIFKEIKMDYPLNQEGPITLLTVKDDYALAITFKWEYEDKCWYQLQLLIKRNSELISAIDIMDIADLFIREIKSQHAQTILDQHIHLHRFRPIQILDTLQNDDPHWNNQDGILIPKSPSQLDEGEDPLSQLNKCDIPFWRQDLVDIEDTICGIFIHLDLDEPEQYNRIKASPFL